MTTEEFLKSLSAYHEVFDIADDPEYSKTQLLGFAKEYADHLSTSQKETIERLRDVLQETTETLMAVRRHGLREEEGYETMVTLVGETIHESEQLLKETEPKEQ